MYGVCKEGLTGYYIVDYIRTINNETGVFQMKELKSIAKVLRFAGFDARVDNASGVVKVYGVSAEALVKIKSIYGAKVL